METCNLYQLYRVDGNCQLTVIQGAIARPFAKSAKGRAVR